MSTLTRVLFGGIDPHLPTIIFAIIAAAAFIRTIVLVTRMITAKKENRKPAKRVKIAACVSSVLVPVMTVLAFRFAPPVVPPPPPLSEFTIPDLTGLDYYECKAEYDGYLNLMGESMEYSSEYPEYTIIRQYPPSGKVTSRGAPDVRCTISKGPRMVTVPNVIGLDLEFAENYCKENFIVEIESEEHSDEYPAGIVISTSPERGEKFEYGGVIKFVVSKGSESDDPEKGAADNDD